MNEINLPAIVKTAQAERVARAKAINNRIATTDRVNLKDAYELGGILQEIKDGCRHGEWIPALREMEISRSRAHDYLELSKCPARDISRYSSIREARANKPVEEEQEKGSEEQKAEPHPTFAKWCQRCQRCRSASCPACKHLVVNYVWEQATGATSKRKKRRGRRAKQEQQQTEERQAGDDTEGEAAAKAEARQRAKDRAANGQPLFDWPGWESKVSPLAQAPDRIAEAYPGEKNCSEFKSAQHGLNLYLEAMIAWRKRLSSKGK